MDTTDVDSNAECHLLTQPFELLAVTGQWRLNVAISCPDDGAHGNIVVRVVWGSICMQSLA